MNHAVFTFIGGDRRTDWAREHLRKFGYSVTDRLTQETTHVVLPYPAYDGDHIRGGPEVREIAAQLRCGMSVLGGQVERFTSVLSAAGARVLDYAGDERFLWENAAITAEAAQKLLAEKLPGRIEDRPILISGFGRIGKLLGLRLRADGAEVTVTARRDADLGMAEAMGFHAILTGKVLDLSPFGALINTVPAQVFTVEALDTLPADAVLMELASSPGGFPVHHGRSIIRAGGLPGKYAPKKAGIALAKAVLRTAERSGL